MQKFRMTKNMNLTKSLKYKIKLTILNEKFKDNGRVLIRASGTEPLVRVMIEGENQDVLQEEATKLAEFYRKRTQIELFMNIITLNWNVLNDW